MNIIKYIKTSLLVLALPAMNSFGMDPSSVWFTTVTIPMLANVVMGLTSSQSQESRPAYKYAKCLELEAPSISYYVPAFPRPLSPENQLKMQMHTHLYDLQKKSCLLSQEYAGYFYSRNPPSLQCLARRIYEVPPKIQEMCGLDVSLKKLAMQSNALDTSLRASTSSGGEPVYTLFKKFDPTVEELKILLQILQQEVALQQTTVDACFLLGIVRNLVEQEKQKEREKSAASHNLEAPSGIDKAVSGTGDGTIPSLKQEAPKLSPTDHQKYSLPEEKSWFKRMLPYAAVAMCIIASIYYGRKYLGYGIS